MRQKRRRTILVLLAAATLIPIAALGWLAVNILRQDRDIEGQHRLERLKYAGGQVALAVEGRLGSMAGLEARPTGRSRLAYSLPTDPRGFLRNPQSRHFQVARPRGWS